MTIQSDSLTAGQYANQITSSGYGLSGVGEASKDSETTLSGNSNAHSAIDLDNATSGQLASVLSSFVGLVHSTASEFEATDALLSQQLGASIPATTLPPSSSKTGENFVLNTRLFGGE
ncbi:TIGR04197 family type VII secretion effector [Streptococcus sp. H31]|uniref:TIGR04197 family type VII secretion effector n=1 Tax=Streptococcus huangxiaojuni TaxID=3237239 RepID=UPI0034A13ADB